ncbi:transcriptional regulator [Wohlfahrtiimonas chitiniclastica]|uniref:helix-turn-helix domain-containing protein n=1 Tax=Wohlfahrtiimonas chitiniclastica TaxID=400946 RepID=UPI000B99864B|nr:helix-turn-helix transcriptional regulator [Wohlfahrtiimonas chitiniclastica]OYQ87976.1 transcriptional regulator [Wohlfahrtiimonas chitiniclastica]
MKQDIQSIFGRRIKQIRESQNLSQEKLAELSDLDRTYISSIERGKRNISLNGIYALSKALNVSLSEIFQNMEIPNE